MVSPKKLEVTALVGLVLQGVFALACFVLSRVSGSQAVGAETWHMIPGLLVWFVVLVHGRQRRLAQQEAEEQQRLKEGRLSAEIFEQTELDTSRASAGLLVLERYLVPVVSLVLSGGLLFFSYRIVRGLWGQTWKLQESSIVAFGMVFISFLGFLVGKYAAGLAQSSGFRLLRAAAGYILGNVMAAILIAVAMAMYYFNIPWGEKVVAYAIPTVMALVGVEVLLNLVLDIYRPRVVGQETRPPYDSRLLGLFAEPQGVFRTVAATLDYQFGFKVSETWFYRFMERAIIPLLLVQLVSLWLLTCLVVVEQDEIVFLETLGKPYLSGRDAAAGLKATVFVPGIYLKAPWPFSVARHVPAYRILKLEVGKIRTEGARPSQGPALTSDVILWREPHIRREEGYEASFLVPSTARSPGTQAAQGVEGLPAPSAEGSTAGAEGRGAESAPSVNLARLDARVYYRVKRTPDGEVDQNAAFDFHYRQSDIQQHVERLAYRAVCRIAASQDFLKWVAQERGQVTNRFRAMLTEAIEGADLGLEVVDAAIVAVHPPSEVSGAYEGVVGALEQKESLVYEGQQASIRTVQQAEALSEELVRGSSGYGYGQQTLAKAEAQEFAVRLQAYEKEPRVYVYRTYFDTIERALPGQRVFVVPVTPREVQILDLEEKLRPGIMEGLGALEGGS